MERKERLVKQVTQAYALTPADQKALAKIIYTERVTAARHAYQEAAGKLRVSLSSDWELPIPFLKRQAEEAQAAAQGIAQTFEQELARQVERAIDAWEAKVERAWGPLSLLSGIADTLLQWIEPFLDFSVNRIARTETYTGYNDGTRQFLDDVSSGDLPGEIDASAVLVEVLPDESSDDFCKEYAGRTFTLEESMSIPDFPAHPNCIHYLSLVEEPDPYLFYNTPFLNE